MRIRYALSGALSFLPKGQPSAQFFKDLGTPTGRTAWARLDLACRLLEREETLDPDWKREANTLVEFVRRNFTQKECGVTACHEQEEDNNAWGGVDSGCDSVLALYVDAARSFREWGDAP